MIIQLILLIGYMYYNQKIFNKKWVIILYLMIYYFNIIKIYYNILILLKIILVIILYNILIQKFIKKTKFLEWLIKQNIINIIN